MKNKFTKTIKLTFISSIFLVQLLNYKKTSLAYNEKNVFLIKEKQNIENQIDINNLKPYLCLNEIEIKPITISDDTDILKIIEQQLIYLDINIKDSFEDYNQLNELNQETEKISFKKNEYTALEILEIIKINSENKVQNIFGYYSFFKDNPKAEEFILNLIETYLNSPYLNDYDLEKILKLSIINSSFYKEGYSASYNDEEVIITLNKTPYTDWKELEDAEKGIIVHEFSHLLEKKSLNNSSEILPSYLSETTANLFANYLGYDKTKSYIFCSHLEDTILLLAFSNRITSEEYLTSIYDNDINEFYNNLGFSSINQKEYLHNIINTYEYLADPYEKNNQEIYDSREKGNIELYLTYSLSLKAYQNLLTTMNEQSTFEEDITIFNMIKEKFLNNENLKPLLEQQPILKLNFEQISNTVNNQIIAHHNITYINNDDFNGYVKKEQVIDITGEQRQKNAFIPINFKSDIHINLYGYNKINDEKKYIK